ncbi:MAG: hypothetical protein EXS38_05905 [Opitutus sp.]|nr:hypothetical protein [Opitutus sp.]
MLDSRVVEQAEGVKLTVGQVQKHPANPLFAEEKPWEVRFDNLYPNVVFDVRARLYRCWYSPFTLDPSTTETSRTQRATVPYQPHDREMGICYATSRDGVHWEKPALGLIEFNGSKANNLVLRDPHGAGIFLDATERDSARRYKLFARASDRNRTIGVAFSPDGLHWSEIQLCPEINVPGDTHNNAFWSPEAGKYVGITRLRTGQRLVARTESDDFIHWTKAVEILRGDPLNQTYAMPVFRHAGVYLGLPMIFRTVEDRVHCELAWSPDTVTWHRIDAGQPLIANSPRAGDYDWGCVYAAATPVFHEKEIRLYYGASNGPHTNWRDSFLALATLRPDGFAGFETAAGGRVGRITTKPLPCAGSQLQITADVTGGNLGVTLRSEAGAVVATAEPVTATSTDQTLRWKNGFDLARRKGTLVRVAFEFTSAKVYSFNFAG